MLGFKRVLRRPIETAVNKFSYLHSEERAPNPVGRANLFNYLRFFEFAPEGFVSAG